MEIRYLTNEWTPVPPPPNAQNTIWYTFQSKVKIISAETVLIGSSIALPFYYSGRIVMTLEAGSESVILNRGQYITAGDLKGESVNNSGMLNKDAVFGIKTERGWIVRTTIRAFETNQGLAVPNTIRVLSVIGVTDAWY